MQIWDTAGQERFKNITASYYRGGNGVLVVYDITDRDSFENLNSWLIEIEKNANKNVYKLLIGNKCDLEDKRKVTYEEAEEVCKQFNIYWGGECSVQEMTKEELDDKFKEIIKEIYRNIGNGEDSGQIVRKLSTGQKQKKKKVKKQNR